MIPPSALFRVRLAHAVLAVSLLVFSQNASAEIAVKSGEKIAFLGDSITAGGWSNPAGYVRLVIGAQLKKAEAAWAPLAVQGEEAAEKAAEAKAKAAAAK